MRIEREELEKLGFEYIFVDKFKKKINNNTYYLNNGEDTIRLSVLKEKHDDMDSFLWLYEGSVKDMEDFKIILKRFYII